MTSQRAKEIYDQHVASGSMDFTRSPIDRFLTNGERQEVMDKWKTMPGSSCFLDAFFSFMEIDHLSSHGQLRRITSYVGEF